LSFDQQQYQRNVNQLRDQLDNLTFMKAWTKGHAMTFEQAVEFALNESER